MQYADITEQIIAAAFKVHNTLGFGYLEKVYENALTPKHEVQLVNYLTATRLDVGLLINFGDRVTIKRKYRVYRPKGSTEDLIE